MSTIIAELVVLLKLCIISKYIIQKYRKVTFQYNYLEAYLCSWNCRMLGHNMNQFKNSDELLITISATNGDIHF